MRIAVILGVVAVVLVTGLLITLQNKAEAERNALFVETTRYGTRLEEEGRHAEAVMAYEQGLDLELTDAQRAEVRYRLANSRIEAGDLNGAYGVLRDLTTEDVARYRIDVGPLYLLLGDRARQAGLRDLARLAYQEGRGVSPARYEEFAIRLDAMITPLDDAPDDGEDE